MTRYYKIIPFQKIKNNDTWTERIKTLLTLDECWPVIIGRPLQLNDLHDLPENTANITTVLDTNSRITVINKEKEDYKAKREKYKLQMAD